mgnify:CR=1 FL=1
MDSSSSSLSTSPDVVLTSSPSSIDVQSTSSLSSNDMIDNSDDHMFFENKVYTTESIRCCLKYKKNKYGWIHGDPTTFGKFLFSSKSTTEVFFQRIFSAHQTGGQWKIGVE